MTHTQEMTSTVMTDQHQFKLIDGQFTPDEAGRVLFAMLKSKIQFHNWESFSNEERFGRDFANSEKRVAELRQACDQVKEVIAYANENNLKFKISSDIHIELM